jgi:hypothetical protein
MAACGLCLPPLTNFCYRQALHVSQLQLLLFREQIFGLPLVAVRIYRNIGFTIGRVISIE